MAQFQIETAQNISISQHTAHIGDRMLAYLIDSFVIGVYVVLTFVLLPMMDVGLEDQWALYLLLNLPALLYYLLLEAMMNGRTIGKALVNIRVVRIDGSRPGFSGYLVRWVLRIVDITLTSGGLAVLTILAHGKGQRVGDIAAGTTVISEKDRIGIQNTLVRELPADYRPRFPQVTVFRDLEMQTIKELYDGAKRRGDHHIIISLSDQIKEVTHITTDLSPIDFVDVVIMDYNFYTQRT